MALSVFREGHEYLDDTLNDKLKHSNVSYFHYFSRFFRITVLSYTNVCASNSQYSWVTNIMYYTLFSVGAKLNLVNSLELNILIGHYNTPLSNQSSQRALSTSLLLDGVMNLNRHF